eukprot:CAMPEP_0117085386 /NCGR_PEP_ID=MMETSP0472-20121206/60033_1 /TAXON_ID=693140 ORGANISM="Tiarina fusus, Strain LIS" /NCGR_SAMPLE_ID=MMETSP0472 /ASSEMBLY_ACC=CAM_ASM_000603 /LENGTH=320 /DNA_ID=CAMNT_0004814637 /DNA_START=215 /DNA_END=1177 /DNA_ORIENTATION=-
MMMTKSAPQPTKVDSDKDKDMDDDPSLVYQRPEVAEAFVNIRDTIPMAKEQIDTMIRIIRHFHIQKIQQQQQQQQQHGNTTKQMITMRWLDLGCGDGPLANRLLQEFPESHGTLVDHSQPMLDLAKTKLQGYSEKNDLDFQLGDFSKGDFLKRGGDDDDDINNNNNTKFDVIVSGFAIHHVPDSRKRTLYQQIFNLLEPGGVFLNMEHVASPTSDIEDIFEGAFCDSMYNAYQQRQSSSSSSSSSLEDKGKGEPAAAKIRSEVEAAVKHDLSVDAEANILAPVEAQCEWLRDIGFAHVDCYFKIFILALFGGVKPQENSS